jgi:hypothetical protein
MDEARPTPDIQARPELTTPPVTLPPLPTEPVPVRSLCDPAVVTKLRLLARCHEAIARTALRRLFTRLGLALLLLLIAGGIGTAAGLGVFWTVYEDPIRYAQQYRDSFGNYTFYVRSQQVNQQRYDYFLRTEGNPVGAILTGLSVGFIVGAVVLSLGWLLTRSLASSPLDALEAEVQAMSRDHPDVVASWGGATVLRQPELVEELLKIESPR